MLSALCQQVTEGAMSKHVLIFQQIVTGLVKNLWLANFMAEISWCGVYWNELILHLRYLHSQSQGYVAIFSDSRVGC